MLFRRLEMGTLVIDGGYELSGKIRVQGAKNGALPILAATLLGGRSVIHNCPRLADIQSSAEILETLGCRVARQGDTVTVESPEAPGCDIPHKLMRCMRSSVIFLGSVLSRCGRAVLSAPGGCQLGPRPIDIHLSAMQSMGARIREENGGISCESAGRLRGADITFPFPSVGATENVILAAASAQGRTVLRGAAREPEIVELADFINLMGGRVKGAGEAVVTIEGVDSLGDCEHTCIPDRIAAATYIAAAVATRSSVTLCEARRADMDAVLGAFVKMGCEFFFSEGELTVFPPKRPRAIGEITTAPYPGFPTDAQALVAAVLATADGDSVINERVFGSRFGYIDGLRRMGADVTVKGGTAVLRGAASLKGAAVECTDLRGGAALVVAALGARGRSVVGRICHIDRGYENIERGLASLGAKIYRT